VWLDNDEIEDAKAAAEWRAGIYRRMEEAMEARKIATAEARRG
jgi:hypothetical protein